MAGPSIDQLFADAGVVRKPPKAPTGITPTFNAANPSQVLTVPTYRDHLSSLTDSRLSQSSQTLLRDMFKHDADVSAAVGSFLTLSDTPMTMIVRDVNGNIDVAATTQLPALVRALTAPTTYLEGFQFKPSLSLLIQEMRYMLMLRGSIGSELIFDKKMRPSRLQHVDTASLVWTEAIAGEMKPSQRVTGRNAPVSLDIPSFFVSYHRRDPTSIYSTSDFVSVINTASARTQVINDLYRIMTVTGYPRMDIKILEETLLQNLPPSVKSDPNPQTTANWIQARMLEVQSTFASLRADQSFVHLDSVEANMLNDRSPGVGIDISNVIDVLNSQNQAALKTMATVIGRGSGAAGVASVEARIAAMNADQLNVPVSNQLSQAFTFLLASYGVPGWVEVKFAPAELRPPLELEAQKSLKASRLLADLSLGIITDEEYHLEMYGRLPPPGSTPISGTNFQNAPSISVDPTTVSANNDPLGKSQSGEGSAAAKGNGKVASKKPR